MKLKKVIYTILLLIFLIPLGQNAFSIFEINELGGAFEEEVINRPQLNIKAYKSGKFQNIFEKYWNNTFGLKNFLIRLNNHFNYSFFNLTNTSGVIVGKSDMLVPESYIKSYYGEDFVGEENIKAFVKKTKVVQDSLKNMSKDFFLMICPGKPYIYPENIPSKYASLYHGENTNYNALISEAEKQGLKVLNLTEYIVKNKSTFNYPIFPTNGVHWSGNTVAHVADTLAGFIQQNTPFSVADVTLSKGKTTITDYRFTDYDIGEAMNLLWNISDDSLHYPQLSFPNMPQKKPTILGVGDSFFQSFYGFYPIIDSLFNQQSRIWSYNKIIVWPRNLAGIKTRWLDLKYEVEQSDIVILQTTDENLKKLGFDFIDNLYELFRNKQELNNPELQPVYDRLANDEEIQKKARKLHQRLGYSEEQMKDALIKDRLRNEWLNDFDYEEEVQKAIVSIKADKNWLETVKEKAIQKNISLEEAIRQDAIWVVNSKLGVN